MLHKTTILYILKTFEYSNLKMFEVRCFMKIRERNIITKGNDLIASGTRPAVTRGHKLIQDNLDLYGFH